MISFRPSGVSAIGAGADTLSNEIKVIIGGNTIINMGDGSDGVYANSTANYSTLFMGDFTLILGTGSNVLSVGNGTGTNTWSVWVFGKLNFTSGAADTINVGPSYHRATPIPS